MDALLLSLYQLAPRILYILLFFHSNRPLIFLITTAPIHFTRHPLYQLVWLTTSRLILWSAPRASLTTWIMGRIIRALFHLQFPPPLERRLLWFKTMLWRLL